MAQWRANAPTRMHTHAPTPAPTYTSVLLQRPPDFHPAMILSVGRWLAKCSTTVATMDPKIAAGSLVLAGANFEGLTAVWPRVLLQELSEHFGIKRKVLVEGMAKLCNA